MLGPIWIVAGCAAVLICALVVWWLRRASEQALPVTRSEALPTSASLDHEVREILARSGKLQAIRWARAKRSMDLRSAKDYVEHIAAGHAAPAVAPAPDAGVGDDEIAALLERGQTIEAIKRVRAATGMGLKEAKDYVDRLRAGDQVGG